MRSLPLPLQGVLRNELRPEEQLLWCCRPSRWAYARGNGWLFGLIGAVWIIGSALLIRATGLPLLRSSTWVHHWMSSWETILWVVPFSLVGLALFLVPPYLFFRAGKVLYAITDRRALILHAGLSIKIRSFFPWQLKNVKLRCRASGRGDVILTSEWMSRSQSGINYARNTGFWCIPDVTNIGNVLNQLADQPTPVLHQAPYEVPATLRDRVRPSLDSGEELLWAGQPRGALYARRSLSLLAFGVWGGSILSIGVLPLLRADALGFLFELFNILPLLLVMGGLLISPLIYYWLALNTVYAITNRRAFIVRTAPVPKTDSILFSQMDRFERMERRDGGGDILFSSHAMEEYGGGAVMRKKGFQAIASVKEVERCLQQVAMCGMAEPSAELGDPT